MKKIAVFASGTGTNFEALANAIEQKTLHAEIVCVVVDKKQALVIEKAKMRGIDTFVFSASDYASKADYEKEIVAFLHQKEVDLCVLAGYMRLCGEVFLQAYEGRIINIHPSLLPAFKGKDAIGQAIDAGVKVMGVTIHYVDASLDGGKIIAQRSFDVNPLWSHEEIEAQVHRIEHVLYPETVEKLLEGQL